MTKEAEKNVSDDSNISSTAFKDAVADTVAVPGVVQQQLNPLALRAALGRREWGVPREFGSSGWSVTHLDRTASVIVTAFDYNESGGIADAPDGEWLHASYCRHDGVMPSYDELQMLHRAVFGDGWAYQVFAPRDRHVNIHSNALHLWGRSDGCAVLPDFVGDSGTV